MGPAIEHSRHINIMSIRRVLPKINWNGPRRQQQGQRPKSDEDLKSGVFITLDGASHFVSGTIHHPQQEPFPLSTSELAGLSQNESTRAMVPSTGGILTPPSSEDVKKIVKKKKSVTWGTDEIRHIHSHPSSLPHTPSPLTLKNKGIKLSKSATKNKGSSSSLSPSRSPSRSRSRSRSNHPPDGGQKDSDVESESESEGGWSSSGSEKTIWPVDGKGKTHRWVDHHDEHDHHYHQDHHHRDGPRDGPRDGCGDRHGDGPAEIFRCFEY